MESGGKEAVEAFQASYLDLFEVCSTPLCQQNDPINKKMLMPNVWKSSKWDQKGR